MTDDPAFQPCGNVRRSPLGPATRSTGLQNEFLTTDVDPGLSVNQRDNQFFQSADHLLNMVEATGSKNDTSAKFLENFIPAVSMANANGDTVPGLPNETRLTVSHETGETESTRYSTPSPIISATIDTFVQTDMTHDMHGISEAHKFILQQDQQIQSLQKALMAVHDLLQKSEIRTRNLESRMHIVEHSELGLAQATVKSQTGLDSLSLEVNSVNDRQGSLVVTAKSNEHQIGLINHQINDIEDKQIAFDQILKTFQSKLFSFDSNAQREFFLPQSGAYLIRINANNMVSAGSYNLGLECP